MNMYDLQGLVFEGGGERKGMDGIVGMEGMLGSEVAGRGGKLNFGRVVGIEGKLGSGGKVGLGSWDGCGRVVGIEGNGGNVVVGFGKFGMVGKGGKFGKFGGVVVCKSWRAARPPLILLRTAKTAKNKAKKMELRKAMAEMKLMIKIFHTNWYEVKDSVFGVCLRDANAMLVFIY